ncbi:DUF2142 domain-containing protein [Cryobacterium suzukii]|uniref:DUF2142 domain-containing protein n=1 Tax=Cryobacterium suzukii TaxID=1259198 RepID=UPI00141BDF88|nr:DUF2142 domain-containing protein [Cryobacterium suzukii]
MAILALSAWALASPVGASPDDDYHLASAWCATNVDTEQCGLVPEKSERSVPNSLLASPCYAFKSTESASCQGAMFEDTNNFVTSDRGNFSGAYPPVYYSVMHLLAGSNIEVSAMLMRVLNILIFVGLTGVLYAILPVSRRPTLVWAWAISLVPLGMFLIASNNPSSWAIISAGTIWISLLGFLETTGARKIGLGLVATIATIVGAGARADAAAYAVVAVVVVLLLTARWDRKWILSTLLPLGLAALAAAFYLSTSQSTLVSSGLHSASDAAAGPGLKSLLINNLLNVPSLWAGVFGTWGLGWLDTTLPAVVWVAGLGCFGALAFSGLISESVRKLLAVTVVLAAVWIIPTYILLKSETFVGSEVQPRYILPLIVMLGGIAILHVGGTQLALSRGQIIALVSALSVSNALSLHFNMRRYLTGTDALGLNLDTNREWWWDIPILPMTVWIVGSVAFVALLLILAPSITRPRTVQSKRKEPGVRSDGDVDSAQPRVECEGAAHGAPPVPVRPQAEVVAGRALG